MWCPGNISTPASFCILVTLYPARLPEAAVMRVLPEKAWYEQTRVTCGCGHRGVLEDPRGSRPLSAARASFRLALSSIRSMRDGHRTSIPRCYDAPIRLISDRFRGCHFVVQCECLVRGIVFLIQDGGIGPDVDHIAMTIVQPEVPARILHFGATRSSLSARRWAAPPADGFAASLNGNAVKHVLAVGRAA